MIFGKTHEAHKKGLSNDNWISYLGVSIFAFFPQKLEDGRWAWWQFLILDDTYFTRIHRTVIKRDRYGSVYTEEQWFNSDTYKERLVTFAKFAPKTAKDCVLKIHGEEWYDKHIRPFESERDGP